jgi:hypothetical protein
VEHTKYDPELITRWEDICREMKVMTKGFMCGNSAPYLVHSHTYPNRSKRITCKEIWTANH